MHCAQYNILSYDDANVADLQFCTRTTTIAIPLRCTVNRHRRVSVDAVATPPRLHRGRVGRLRRRRRWRWRPEHRHAHRTRPLAPGKARRSAGRPMGGGAVPLALPPRRHRLRRRRCRRVSLAGQGRARTHTITDTDEVHTRKRRRA